MKRDLYVAKSGIAGKGVFTKKPFKKGESVLIFRGKEKTLHIENEQDSALNPNWVGIGKNLWRDIEDEVTQYVNHSCNPNMGIKGRVTCVALRDIRAGEEVTFDYSITEEDKFWKMKNGEDKKTKRYRPIIQSIQSLPREVYKSYLPYVPRYFQKVYEQHHNLKSKK